MTFRLIGYFPKQITRATAAMGLPGVTEIWSVSNCISSGPPDWIKHWRHNAFGLFDTPELARSVIPADASSAYRILGYRVWSQAFGEGANPFEDTGSLQPSAAADFSPIGYDAVSCTYGHDFEHSPLSCNGAAKTFAATHRCLFRSADEAIAAAAAFESGNWEPGPYFVVEVLAQCALASDAG